MSINVIEVKRRLFNFLHDSNLVNEYIARYGPVVDIKNIRTFKDGRVNTQAAAPHKNNHAPTPHSSTEVITIGQDPVYSVKVKCPVCDFSSIEVYELRAKSQKITQSKFLVPLYEGAMGYRTVNFINEAVTVCPQCLFASPDKKDFIRAETTGHSEMKSQLAAVVISTLSEKKRERRDFLGTVQDPALFFKRPRIKEAVIASYRLAMMRAHIEAAFEQPYAYFKLGSYMLRIARVVKENQEDPTAMLKEALAFFEEAFRMSNCPSEEIEMQVLYLLVALNMRVADQTKAASFLNCFTSLRSNRLAEIQENPKLTTTVIDKWAQKARELWEDRDRSDAFDTD